MKHFGKITWHKRERFSSPGLPGASISPTTLMISLNREAVAAFDLKENRTSFVVGTAEGVVLLKEADPEDHEAYIFSKARQISCRVIVDELKKQGKIDANRTCKHSIYRDPASGFLVIELNNILSKRKSKT